MGFLFGGNVLEYVQYIRPELTVLIPVLYIMGKFLKESEKFKDKHIPMLLLIIGVIMSGLYIVSEMGFSFYAVFMAVIQGTLCAGVTLLGNRLIKRSNKHKDGK